ncbi:MAG TPA: cadherin-like beta sandwich domain-containing protein, partial [Symbiobacteriaceae bacterium]|nr:cadherin-like beta sandwich domain-containing protein [Symbiobacteriaceae bacterium]
MKAAIFRPRLLSLKTTAILTLAPLLLAFFTLLQPPPSAHASPSTCPAEVISGSAGQAYAENGSPVAQIFTPSSSGQLLRAGFYGYRMSGSGNLPYELRTVVGGMPTGPILASGSAAPVGGDFQSQYFTLTFSSPVSVTAGTQYALVARPTSATYVLDYGSDSYAGGSALGYNLGSWVSLIGGQSVDLRSNLYLDSGQAPSSDASLKRITAYSASVAMSPAFAATTYTYAATYAQGTTSVLVRANANSSCASVAINGQADEGTG